MPSTLEELRTLFTGKRVRITDTGLTVWKKEGVCVGVQEVPGKAGCFEIGLEKGNAWGEKNLRYEFFPDQFDATSAEGKVYLELALRRKIEAI